MENLTSWTELFFESMRSFGSTLLGALPGVFGAILILLIGWLFAKIVAGSISRLLRMMKFDVFAQKIKADEMLQRANVKIAPSAIIGKFIYWVLLLLVLITASETLGWEAVSTEISKLVSYLPTLLSAIVIFIIGVYIATFVKELIAGATKSLGISTGKMISNFIFYILFIIVTLTALDQGGIDTSIITSNLLLILGAILIAASISYGFASRTILSNVLASFFSRNTFNLGQTIEVDGVKGEIVEINKISITLKNVNNERVVIPTHFLIDTKVKIFG